MATSPSNGNALVEWKEARSVIARFDKSLQDLRKYGFSFVTAVMAADSVIGQATGTGPLIVTPRVKFAIILATMVLVIALYTIDRFSRSIQYGAQLRAIEIEKNLDIGLTTKINDIGCKEKAGAFTDGLYYLFILAATVLGIALVWSNVLLESFLLIALVAAWAYVGLLHLWCLEKSGEWHLRAPR
jgi:hypothetical protein